MQRLTDEWDYSRRFMDYQTRITKLRRYVVNEERRTRCGKDVVSYELVAAMIKDQSGDFKAVHDVSVEVSFEVPINWFEHLKQSLPKELQFGWLKPRLKKLSETVKQATYLTLNTYQVRVTPTGVRYVEQLTSNDMPPLSMYEWLEVRQEEIDRVKANAKEASRKT